MDCQEIRCWDFMLETLACDVFKFNIENYTAVTVP